MSAENKVNKTITDRTKNAIEQALENHTTKVEVTSKSNAESRRQLNLDRWRKRALICFTLIALCALGIVALSLMQILSVPISIIFWTLIIVFLLRGIVAGLENKGMNRVLGTAVAYVIMFLILAVLFVFMFSPAFGITEQIGALVAKLPQYAEIAKAWFNDLISQYGDFLQNDQVKSIIDDAASGIASLGGGLASSSAQGLLEFGGTVGNTFMALGIALVVSFWFLIELPNLGKEFMRFVKPKYEESVNMWHYVFTRVMAGYIKGTFLQCAIIGLGAGLLYWALGIGNCAALGTITGVLNIIPIIGPWIGGVVAALAGAFTSPFACIVALAGTIAIQSVVYTFISPKIMSNAVDIHPALSLLALTVGSAVGGAMAGIIGALVGMLFSIPAVAVFKSLFVYYYEKRTHRRIIASDGVFFKGTPVGDDSAKPMIDAVAPNPAVIKNALSSEESMKDFADTWGIKVDDLKKLALDKSIRLNNEAKEEIIEDLERKDK